MNRSKTFLLLLIVFTCLAVAAHAGAASIKDSPHNLSAGSSAAIHASTETRICIFCHTPHGANKLKYDPTYTGPLWNRDENLAMYQPYASDTITAKPGQPLGASRLCLSCHDGTIALGAPRAHKVTEVLDRSMSPENVIGTDLRNDHPVSMEYYLKPDEFREPSDPKTARLLKPRGIPYVECTSCHDPHNNENGKFLVVVDKDHKDALCTVCHNKSGWSQSTHMTGGLRYVGTGIPEAVAQNGCISCHTPHGAQRGVALLKLPAEGASIDTNCTTACHNGNPYSNLQTPSGTNTHTLGPVVSDLHGQTESLPLATEQKHVHCVDCHNPHQANFTDSPLVATNAPDINGPLKGVRGVDISGQPIVAPLFASYEYQICFRCHAGPSSSYYVSTLLTTQRLFYSPNESDRFNPATARSYHPVAGSWTAGGVSLRSDLPRPQHIYCSSCHDPHGSSERHLLYPLLGNPDTFSASAATFPLCYSCHSDTYIMDTTTDRGKLHKAHVYGLHNPSSATANPLYWNYKAPCSVCHDPHGVPMVGGSTADNSAHLINFDRRFVPAGATYSASGRSCSITGSGELGSMTCHAGVSGYSYQAGYPYNPL